MGKHYLYRHIRLDDDEPFYVGVGTKNKRTHSTIESEYNRAYSKSNRSGFWKNIIGVTEYEVEILLESDDYECNLTDGGEGTVGRVLTKEQKEISRQTAIKTFTGKAQTEEHIRKRFLNMCGENNPNFGVVTTEEIKQKLREALSGENSYASKRVINDETGEIYYSVKNAAECCGYNYSTLRAYLNGSLRNPTKLRYYE
jgi:hypothetical protein